MKINKVTKTFLIFIVAFLIYLDLPHPYSENAKAVASEEKSRISAALRSFDSDSVVSVFPRMVFPENGPVAGLIDYTPLKLVLSSADLSFDYGARRPERVPEYSDHAFELLAALSHDTVSQAVIFERAYSKSFLKLLVDTIPTSCGEFSRIEDAGLMLFLKNGECSFNSIRFGLFRELLGGVDPGNCLVKPGDQERIYCNFSWQEFDKFQSHSSLITAVVDSVKFDGLSRGQIVGVGIPSLFGAELGAIDGELNQTFKCLRYGRISNTASWTVEPGKTLSVRPNESGTINISTRTGDEGSCTSLSWLPKTFFIDASRTGNELQDIFVEVTF